MEVVIHGAGVQDRDGAPGLIDQACETYPALVKPFADGGYAGKKREGAVAHITRLSIDIIKRWLVERTLALA